MYQAESLSNTVQKLSRMKKVRDAAYIFWNEMRFYGRDFAHSGAKQPHITNVCFSSYFFRIIYSNRLDSKLLNGSIKFAILSSSWN